ncbi:hypothetical protein ALC62_12924 [Cyphomyrmex costatus]|uniref:Uncharacterized protein n=1 Tax=Cyphomyrmex costatus TaxID=456900 RepID=A0A195C8G8_9HYME|nr:hypothetical protein ALC62_12924 [Cyphomyrmex costatus]
MGSSLDVPAICMRRKRGLSSRGHGLAYSARKAPSCPAVAALIPVGTRSRLDGMKGRRIKATRYGERPRDTEKHNYCIGVAMERPLRYSTPRRGSRDETVTHGCSWCPPLFPDHTHTRVCEDYARQGDDRSLRLSTMKPGNEPSRRPGLLPNKIYIRIRGDAFLFILTPPYIILEASSSTPLYRSYFSVITPPAVRERFDLLWILDISRYHSSRIRFRIIRVLKKAVRSRSVICYIKMQINDT